MDKSDANEIFGSANIENIVYFKLEKDHTDFGDFPHLGGAPIGDAIIVWSIDGRVAIKGVLFCDSLVDPLRARIEIRFRRATGRFTNWTYRSVSRQDSLLSPASKLVEKVSPVDTFDQVHIRLYSFNPNTGLGPVDRKLWEGKYNR